MCSCLCVRDRKRERVRERELKCEVSRGMMRGDRKEGGRRGKDQNGDGEYHSYHIDGPIIHICCHRQWD